MSIYRKLQSFQDAAPTVHKNCTANMNGRQYRYADLNSVLDAIKPALKVAKLVMIQTIDDQTLVTKLVDSESNESIESRFPLEFHGLSWHGIGSALSYARRYSILSLLGLAPDDDDDAISTLPDRSSQAIQTIGDCIHCGEPMSIGPKTGKPYCKPCFLAKRNGYAAMS